MQDTAHVEREILEIEKIRRETDKLVTEALKAAAEASKTAKEAAWYPWATLFASNVSAAVIGVAAAHIWR